MKSNKKNEEKKCCWKCAREVNMTDDQIEFVKKCISDNDVHRFYCRKEWLEIREKVLKFDHYECQKCKKKGKYRKAILVHHVNHLKDKPSLALEMYDEKGERNLVSLCQSCHEEEHPEERHRWHKSDKVFINEERW